MSEADALSRTAREYLPSPQAFAERVILVTGATQGIGRAVAESLVRLGAQTILLGRNLKALDTLHAELGELGPEPAMARLDFERAQGDQYNELTDQIEARFGRLDGLLHNAGILGDRSPIEFYDIGVWQKVMHVNLNAAFILTRCLLPLLRQSQDASIVFTTSSVGHQGRAHWGAYAASKFATEGLMQVLAAELGQSPIRVNCINPGSTRTRMRSQAFPGEDPDSLPQPADIVNPYLYLLGSASRGVTGQRIACQQRAPSRA
ncbi:MAG TPA: YciK family oxidoreductase [Gammaproteobacteria bacterium]|nr:YciK family oxidoreductase [Gammaproteobacteria bacterium]